MRSRARAQTETKGANCRTAARGALGERCAGRLGPDPHAGLVAGRRSGQSWPRACGCRKVRDATGGGAALAAHRVGRPARPRPQRAFAPSPRGALQRLPRQPLFALSPCTVLQVLPRRLPTHPAQECFRKGRDCGDGVGSGPILARHCRQQSRRWSVRSTPSLPREGRAQAGRAQVHGVLISATFKTSAGWWRGP